MATAVLLTCGVAPLQSKAETLQEAIQALIDSNPDVRSSAYLRLSRDEQVRQAKADYYPNLDFVAGTGVQTFYEPVEFDRDPTEYRLSLRQNLFTGFGTKHNVARTRHHANSGALRVQSISEETSLEGSRAYLGVLRRQQLVDLAKENLTNHLRIADQIRMRSKSGVARRADVDQINSRVALARSNVVAAESNLEDEITRYFKVMGHIPEDLVAPESKESILPASVDEAQRQAVVNHPTLKAIEEDLLARKSQVGIAKSAYYPVLDLEIDRNWRDEFDGFDSRDADFLAMLRLRYNFFKGFKDQARKKETIHLVDDAEQARNETARLVLENIRLAWVSYVNAQRRVGYLEERVVAAKKTVDAYGKQFNIGKRTLLDVLDSEAAWIEARSKLLDEKFNYQFAQYRLLSGSGRLVASLGLQYPEEAYIEDK
ncbi:MAG: TolC family outer membrane protein [Gammaproteobacteria bacterium]|nr:TolC family outer membrane protein [Gammaproteobacteria bacterium]